MGEESHWGAERGCKEAVTMYERTGCFDELIGLLEQGLGLELAQMGMFTELGIA